jgi:hypothetical protein
MRFKQKFVEKYSANIARKEFQKVENENFEEKLEKQIVGKL